MKGMQLPDGGDRIVRHGHGPERQVQTGIGPVAVQRVKLRDHGANQAAERIRFTSAILPRWARRTRSLDALLPILYLRGVDGRLPGGARGPAGQGRPESVAIGGRAPLVRTVRCRKVPNMLSIGFDVRRWSQCSVG